MKVKELIEELKKYNPQKEVKVESDEMGTNPIFHVLDEDDSIVLC